MRTNKESLALKELIEAISRRRETSSHDFVMLMCQGIGGTNNSDSMERIVSRLFANFIPLRASFSSSRDFLPVRVVFRKMTKL